MRVNNINNNIVYKNNATWSQEEYDKYLQKRADAVAKTLMVTSGLATAGYLYAVSKYKDKGGIFKHLLNKIKDWFGIKPN